MDYCDVFISCLNSHSDGTHSLHKHFGWPEAEYIFSMFIFAQIIPSVSEVFLNSSGKS